MPTELPIEHGQLIDAIAAAMKPFEPAEAVEAAPSLDARLALDQANELLTLALNTQRAAYDHLAEAPDDVTDANNAVQQAQQTVQQLRDIASGRSKGNARDIAGKISTLASVVTQAAGEVVEHEAGTSSDSAKRLAHEAQLKEARDHQAAMAAAGRKSKAPRIHHAPAARPLSPEQERQRRYRGEHDGNDERDQEVGVGARRRARKATSEGGRRATRVLSHVMAEDTADEIVSTVGTGAQRMGQGASGFMSGDAHASDQGALAVGRGVRNVLRDDLGILSAENAQTVGHAATVTLQTAGRGAVAVRNSAVAVGSAIATTADDARDRSVSYALTWTTLGKEINDLLPILQKSSFAKGLDTDKDGKVELNEVMAMLRKAGITDMKAIDRDHNGDISTQELVPVLVKHVARSKS